MLWICFCAVTWCGSQSRVFWPLLTRLRRRTFANIIRSVDAYRKTWDRRRHVRCGELWQNTSWAFGRQSSSRNSACFRCASLQSKSSVICYEQTLDFTCCDWKNKMNVEYMQFLVALICFVILYHCILSRTCTSSAVHTAIVSVSHLHRVLKKRPPP